MKIALIFSGLPRLVEQSFPFFHERLIKNNDIDVFSFVWKIDDYLKLDNFYNHTILQYQKPINFFSTRKETRINIYSHWYSLQYACLSFKQYVEQHNVEYDFIIRTRHDLALFHTIDFNHFKTDQIYVADCHWPNHYLFDDNLMILNQKNYFKIFSNIFNWYDSRKDFNTYDQIPEQELQHYLDHINMKNKIVRDKNLDFILTRGLL